MPPAQPVPGERSSSHDLELGPTALTPLLSRKARPEGFVKSNKDSKQGFFFFLAARGAKKTRKVMLLLP